MANDTTQTREDFLNSYTSSYTSWASRADASSLKKPTTAKQSSGWAVEIPTHSAFNWWQNRTDKRLVNLEARLEWAEANGLAGADGADGKDGHLIYEMCEIYYFRHPDLKPGFVAAYGSLISNADKLYPEAWDYLQTAAGQKLCKTEAQWTSLNNATYFKGVGGAPWYVINTANKTIRVPDVRGMYMEAAGFDGLAVSGVHADMVRNITGTVGGIEKATGNDNNGLPPDGAFYANGKLRAGWQGGPYSFRETFFDASRVVPTGNANKPKAFGAMPCVYLGS